MTPAYIPHPSPLDTLVDEALRLASLALGVIGLGLFLGAVGAATFIAGVLLS